MRCASVVMLETINSYTQFHVCDMLVWPLNNNIIIVQQTIHVHVCTVTFQQYRSYCVIVTAFLNSQLISHDHDQ